MTLPTVRRIRPDDLPDLVALYTELTNGAPVVQGDDGRARLAEIIAHPGTYVFAADIGGQVCAVATLHICPNLTFGGRPYARIENVVTLHSHRGHGLGRMVMQAAIDQAWAQDAVSIILLTGKALRARGFYESLGFETETKWGMILRATAQDA